jgi:hypothetical protein
VSCETAAHRFTNLATRRLDIPVHFMRIASTGVIYKAYENGLHFPTDATGAIEGQRVCRYWTARAVFDRPDVSSAYQKYTDTTSGTYWCTAVVDRTPAGPFSVSVGVPLHPGEVDARTRDKGALHVQVPRSRLLVTAARGPGHPLGRTGVAQRPGAFTPAGRHAAWSVSWRRRHRSAEVLGTTRRSLRPPGRTPAAVVIAFGGDRCRVLRLARRPERLRPTR